MPDFHHICSKKCDLNFIDRSWRTKVFLTRPNCIDVCRLELTTQRAVVELLKICYVGDYNRNVDGGLEGQQFKKLNWGWLFDQPSTQVISNWHNDTLVQKRGIILKLAHKSRNPYFLNFWEALQSEAAMPNSTPSTWVDTPQHMSNWKFQR